MAHKFNDYNTNKNLRDVDILLNHFDGNDENFENLMRQLDSIKSPRQSKSSLQIDFLEEKDEEQKNITIADENALQETSRMLDNFPSNEVDINLHEDIMEISPKNNSYFNLSASNSRNPIQREDSIISDIERYALIMIKPKVGIAKTSNPEPIYNEVYDWSMKSQPSEETLASRMLNNEFKPYGVFIKKTEMSSPPIKYYTRTNLLFYSQGDRRLEAEVISLDKKNPGKTI